MASDDWHQRSMEFGVRCEMKSWSKRLDSLTEDHGGMGDAIHSEDGCDSSVEAGSPEITQLRNCHVHHRGVVLVNEEGRHAQDCEVKREPYVVAIAVGF